MLPTRKVGTILMCQLHSTWFISFGSSPVSQVFSRKFTLSVIDSTQIDKATEEDKASKIDYWARLFKAKTWEELQMLAQNDEYLQAAATSIRIANEEDMIREHCRAREDALRRERTLERDNKILLAEKQELLDKNIALQHELSNLRKQLAALQAQVADK